VPIGADRTTWHQCGSRRPAVGAARGPVGSSWADRSVAHRPIGPQSAAHGPTGLRGANVAADARLSVPIGALSAFEGPKARDAISQIFI
jgi:hypothetical protein